MTQAYELAAKAVRARLALRDPEALALLDGLGGRVAVYQGSYDQVETVLGLLGVTCTMDPKPGALERADIVFVNCSRSTPDGLVEQVGEWVNDGGWLVTSDWAVHNVLTQAFPNTVRRLGNKMTGYTVVGVEPENHSLWAELTVPGAEPQWSLEGSYPIEVLDPDVVRVEAASHELMCDHGAAPIAVRFDRGAGHVFHVISHFHLRTSRAPTALHQQDGRVFLRDGLGLPEATIDGLLEGAEAPSFGQLQSTVTTTWLVARLCVEAARHAALRAPVPAPAPAKRPTFRQWVAAQFATL
jgi:hypothetical protein